LNAAETVLERMLGSPGVLGATLIDAVTGLRYAVVGDGDAVGAPGDEARCVENVAETMVRAGASGDLEGIVVTSTERLHVTQVIPRQGDDLLLCVAMDRRDTNFALAVRDIAQSARELLA
jgi:hypothetical protein